MGGITISERDTELTDRDVEIIKGRMDRFVESGKDLEKKCCICGREFKGWGNDPWPIVVDSESVCCDQCNWNVVVPARMKNRE